MARPRPSIPTPTEQRALNFLYEHGPATVREYLIEGTHPDGHAYTSVLSLFDTMFRKEMVSRTEEKRAFRYKPVLSQNQLRAQVVQSVLNDVFEGDTDALKAAVAVLTDVRKK